MKDPFPPNPNDCSNLAMLVHGFNRQPNAPYSTSAPEMGTGADRVRVLRAAGRWPERGGGVRESRHAGAAAPAPLGRCARLGDCEFASDACVTHTSDTLLDHLLLHFEIRMSNFGLTVDNLEVESLEHRICWGKHGKRYVWYLCLVLWLSDDSLMIVF